MPLSKMLLQRGQITHEQLARARASANGRSVDEVLLKMGAVSEEEALMTLADELGMRYVDLRDYAVDAALLARFPTTAIFRHTLLPLEMRDGSVEVATSDPFDLEALDELSSMSGLQLRPVLARREDVLQLIKKHLGVGGDTINELVAREAEQDIELIDPLALPSGDQVDAAQAASVVRLVNELLVEALTQRSSDVHIEPQEDGLTVRYRVDGMLQVQPMPPEINQFYAAIVSRLKIMARLNIAEKRLPQDGRINIRIAGREIDVRVSIIPMLYGEGIVLRLLDKEQMVFDLQTVGMPAQMADKFKQLIRLPHGIILATGPTGSGKTTTLYASLNEIKSPSTKIITIEDPVEYHTSGIGQIQVHSKIGMTFAAGLRSILRHDPDVVLIGEVRDGETAQSAIQAALTGHLVFSTLHTNDAPGAYTRLIEMGVEPYLVASTLQGVLAQRLLRLLCPHCKQAGKPSHDDLPSDFPFDAADTIFLPVGCRECHGTGYSGRTGIYELLATDHGVRKLCTERADANQIREHAIAGGMMTLRQCGWQRVLDGVTSVDEVMRVTAGDDLSGSV